ncbi:MAG: bifunctional glycosyltransferase/class I SAM-dependent methyltransferase [Chloroflexota bacterium]
MNKPMLLSILIPVYDERYRIRECIRRVLAAPLPENVQREIIIVDDGSKDGTSAILSEIAAANPKDIRLIVHPKNQGKGAAIRTAVRVSNGDIILFQDADLEYDPNEYAKLLAPILDGEADAVFGSRFLSGERRRVLYFWHSVANFGLTALSNMQTNLNLTDMETCYKVILSPFIKTLPIRSNRFGIEPEITAKLAKQQCRIYEVPISYHGRTYDEGKKIKARDAFNAIAVMFRFWLVDDLYGNDQIGQNILHEMDKATHFNDWMADTVRGFLGQSTLEIGAGIGNLTAKLCNRESYISTDMDEMYISRLRRRFMNRPNIRMAKLDVTSSEDTMNIGEQVDSIVCLNVLEHVPDHVTALKNMHTLLAEGGRMVLLVPQGQWLYGTLDRALDHCRRYSRAELTQLVRDAGFEIEDVLAFNHVGVLGWWFSGKILKRQTIDRVQLKVLDSFIWAIKRFDHLLPWPALSLIVIAKKPDSAPQYAKPSVVS